jgi:hypothetical protein
MMSPMTCESRPKPDSVSLPPCPHRAHPVLHAKNCLDPPAQFVVSAFGALSGLTSPSPPHVDDRHDLPGLPIRAESLRVLA